MNAVLCYAENNRHFENRHRMLRMECVRRHPGQSEVLVESQTAAGRVPSVWTS